MYRTRTDSLTDCCHANTRHRCQRSDRIASTSAQFLITPTELPTSHRPSATTTTDRQPNTKRSRPSLADRSTDPLEVVANSLPREKGGSSCFFEQTTTLHEADATRYRRRIFMAMVET